MGGPPAEPELNWAGVMTEPALAPSRPKPQIALRDFLRQGHHMPIVTDSQRSVGIDFGSRPPVDDLCMPIPERRFFVRHDLKTVSVRGVAIVRPRPYLSYPVTGQCSFSLSGAPFR